MHIAMWTLRELIRLLFMELGLSYRKMGRIIGCHHDTVKSIKLKIGALTYTYDEYKVMRDDELVSIFYPKINLRRSSKRRPNFEEIIREVNTRPRKYGKKKKLMFLEYKEQDPKTALGQTQFYHLANKYCKESKLELKQEYYPGEYLCCDYAGIPLFVSEDGVKRKVYVFVACLPFSRKIFAYATKGMTANDWILGLAQAVLYYGKVAKIILFDNAKAMVRKAGLIAELSEKIIDFAQYHNNFCDTARVITPRDNCHGEKSVQFFEDRISLVLREMTFFSLDDLNKTILIEVEKLNNEIMPAYQVSRNELFLQEMEYLLDAPKKPYELLVKQGSVKAPANYLIKYQSNYYSVPYQYRAHMVTFKATKDYIKFYCNGEFIAQHQLVEGKDVITRLSGHMPENHLVQVRKTQIHFTDWAKNIGESCLIVIEKQYKDHANKKSQHAGKRCLAIQHLASKFSPQEFDSICHYADEHEMYSPSDLKLIVQSGILEEQLFSSIPLPHANVRGAEHYQGRI